MLWPVSAKFKPGILNPLRLELYETFVLLTTPTNVEYHFSHKCPGEHLKSAHIHLLCNIHIVWQ